MNQLHLFRFWLNCQKHLSHDLFLLFMYIGISANVRATMPLQQAMVTYTFPAIERRLLLNLFCNSSDFFLINSICSSTEMPFVSSNCLSLILRTISTALTTICCYLPR